MPGPGRPPGRCTVVNTVVYQFKYTSANLNIPILVSPGQLPNSLCLNSSAGARAPLGSPVGTARVV